MYGNPYYMQPPRFQTPNNQNMMQQYIPPMPQPTVQNGLLGKSVDSIEVVKAMDIPLDGSISYFPLTDGSAIISKQLQNDGTSRTIIYKPIIEDKKETIKYVQFDDIEDLKKEIEELKKEIKNLKKNKDKE